MDISSSGQSWSPTLTSDCVGRNWSLAWSGSTQNSKPFFSQPAHARLFVFSYSCEYPGCALATQRQRSQLQDTVIIAEEDKIAESHELWPTFFPNPSHCWNIRFPKKISRYSDFALSNTKDTSWVDGWYSVPRSAAELTTFEHGTLSVDCGLEAASSQNSSKTNEARRDNRIRPEWSGFPFSFSTSWKSLDKVCMESSLIEGLQIVKPIEQEKLIFRLLQTCISKRDLAAGREVHGLIVRSGLESDAFFGSHLILMFGFVGSLGEANQVFCKLSEPSVFSWSAIITAHVKLGKREQAINLYNKMQKSSVQLSRQSFVVILKACSTLVALEWGKQIHADIIECDFESDVIVASALMDMYVNCRSLEQGQFLFDRMPCRNIVVWSSLITGYTELGNAHEALWLFEQMQKEGVKPDSTAFVCSLKACSRIASLEQGQQLHTYIVENGLELHIFVGNALIDMYAKCGSLKDACMLFDRMPKRDIVTWSALIAGYARHMEGQKALLVFKQMQQKGMEPNSVTFVSALKACSSIAALEQGRWIHTLVIESGMEFPDVFVGNALTDMYAKCGSLCNSQMVFHRLLKRDVVTWSVLIAGYVQHEHCQQALQVFNQMQQAGMTPSAVTYVGILQACSSIAALEQGKQIHFQILGSGSELGTILGNALIDMYAKCGSLENACLVFQRLPNRDVVTWTSLISGYAQHNEYLIALTYFDNMQQAGFKPDSVTFLGLISACSRLGLLDQGRLHFKSMRDEYSIVPTVQLHNSMVDLLGHAGHLNEAEDLLETNPFQQNVVGWKSLLSSCRAHADVDLGKRCFNLVVVLDDVNAAGYVLMSNIYMHAGMHKDAEEVEKLRRHANRWKKPGKAFIEIDNHVHDFIVGGKTHPRTEDIHAKLKLLSMQLREEGYKPHVELVLKYMADEEKENACEHSEKLAVAFGLISTPQGTSIRVAKNIRMCSDCHTATKLIAKIEQREIVIMDGYCIHRFQGGVCSCKDYY